MYTKLSLHGWYSWPILYWCVTHANWQICVHLHNAVTVGSSYLHILEIGEMRKTFRGSRVPGLLSPLCICWTATATEMKQHAICTMAYRKSREISSLYRKKNYQCFTWNLQTRSKSFYKLRSIELPQQRTLEDGIRFLMMSWQMDLLFDKLTS